MLLWRLSARQYAGAFNGGYGLRLDGRWNTAGHAVTYCSTSPALCVLEKLVHVEDPALLPELIMLHYEVPDALGIERIGLDTLPPDWRRQEALTQSRGDAWHRSRAQPLLQVPSAIVPLPGSPDMNVLINHTHESVGLITLAGSEPFVFDPRPF